MYVLAWCCTSMLLGIWFWPYWVPDQVELVWAGGCICFLVMLSRNRLSLYALFFVLGSVIVARLPPSKSYEGAIIADVQGRVCGAILLYSNKGRFLVQFFGEAPREGERIAARIVPSVLPNSLPGESNHGICQKRAHASYARIRSWFSFGDNKPLFAESSYRFVEHGGMLWSLMSGDRRFINKETVLLLRNTGTAHFLAISGMHIGLVSALMYGCTRILCIPFLWWNFYLTFRFVPCVVAIGAAIGYANHVGWPTSAQRSVCMVGLFFLAFIVGRKEHIWTILLLTASIIVYREPSQLDSLSFRLSFSAVAGIVWFVPRVTRLIPLDAHPIYHRIGGAFAISFGASLGTFPWVCFYFQEFPWVGLISNVFVSPLLGGVAVTCALLACISNGFLEEIALVVGDASIELSHTILSLLNVEPWIIAFNQYEVCFVVGIFLIRRKDIVRIILLCSLIFFPRCSPEETIVTFLAIGQGDCILVEWDDGRVWLIDGGPPSKRLVRMLRRKKIDTIEHVFLSHPHLDHFGGLPYLLGEISMKSLWTVRPPKAGENRYASLFQKALENSVLIRYPDEQPPFPIRFLHPIKEWKSRSEDSVNEESFVFDMDIEGAKLLFTGDIGMEAEDLLVDSGRLLDEYDVVKVAHHGSRYSSGHKFIDAVRAEHAIISCGRENRFEHPHNETLFRWGKSQIWRTDEDGSIYFHSVSKRLWGD